jgi:tRNA(fMet)-specific endonuclease VapC
MKRYLLDTGIAADYINLRHSVYEQAREAMRRGDRVGICTPVLGELWSGVELSASRERNALLLNRWLPHLVLWPYDELAAEEFGRLFARLRRMGRPMQQIDVQIAAIARSLGNCTVVTKDTDFAAIPELDIVDWSQTAT